MNDQKPKFYKRWWFRVSVGVIGGAVLLFAGLILYSNIHPLYPHTYHPSTTEKSVSFSGCVATPPSIALAPADFRGSEEQIYTGSVLKDTATLNLTNSDSQPHRYGETDNPKDAITLAPGKSTRLTFFNGASSAVITCDGKDSLTVTVPTSKEIDDWRSAQSSQKR